MRGKDVLAILSVVVIAISATLAYLAFNPLPPGLDKKPHEALGWSMAGEAIKLLQPGGEITVITRDTSAFKNPATDIQLASFRKAVGKAGAKLGTVHALQIDPLRPVEVPPGDFLEFIRNTPKGCVIVSFMGPPKLSPAQREELKSVQPRIVALCPPSSQESIDLQWLFDQGLLHTAIVSRMPPSSSASPPKDLKGWFERYFILVSPNQLSKGGRNASL